MDIKTYNLIKREQEEKRCSEDPIYFIDTYCKTFDPRPEVFPHDIPFKLYEFQKLYVAELVEAIKGNPVINKDPHDIFTEKSRDMGISWVTLAVAWWFWRWADGCQGLLGSRKEDYVDNSQIDSLFGKLDYITRTMPDWLLPRGFDISKHRTYMKLVNPENQNALIGESSNKNFSRAGRYLFVLFDEIGFWNDARSAWQAAGDATRCRIGITTPPNEPSFAKALRFSGMVKILTYIWNLHPKKDQKWYDYQKTRRTEDEMLHEIDISWEYTSTGRPYPEVDQCPVGQYPYDPNLPLYNSWDLGLDAVALGWFQPVPNSDWITLVDCYENSDKIIDFFLPLLGKPIDSKFIYNDQDLEMIELVKYWKQGNHFGDPSGKQRHIESGTSAYNTLRDAGITVQTNDKANDWPTRRDETRKVLMHLRINDTPRTRWFVQCVKSARYPKREENSQATTPIVKPVHDWTSHMRTMLEFFAVNFNYIPTQTPKVATYRRNYAVR